MPSGRCENPTEGADEPDRRHAAHQSPVLGVIADPAHEAGVDLDHVDRQLAQVGERAEPGAEPDVQALVPARLGLDAMLTRVATEQAPPLTHQLQEAAARMMVFGV